MNKAQLAHGRYYEGNCRNATVARWNADHNRFFHWRAKFGHKYVEDICHPDDEQYFDVFLADRELEAPDEPIPFPGEEGYNGVFK